MVREKMKSEKMRCERCGVEFKYLNDLDLTPKGREFEDFILEHGGDYCRKCTADMIDEIQEILDRKEEERR